MLKTINRITKKSEIDRFFGKSFKDLKGRNYSTSNLVVKVMISPDPTVKFGLIVSNKIDNKATVRNRIKRRLRETIRIDIDKYIKNINVLIVAQPKIKALSNKAIETELLSLFKKAKIYKNV